jgi:hypothetical protein
LLQGYAIWVKECRGHLPKGHGNSISRHDAQRDEVFVDDMIAKSREGTNHVQILKELFERGSTS